MQKFISAENWKYRAILQVEGQFRALNILENEPHLPSKVETILLAANIAIQNSVSCNDVQAIDMIAHSCNILGDYGQGYSSKRQVGEELGTLLDDGLIIKDERYDHRYIHRLFVPKLPSLFVFRDDTLSTKRL